MRPNRCPNLAALLHAESTETSILTAHLARCSSCREQVFVAWALKGLAEAPARDPNPVQTVTRLLVLGRLRAVANAEKKFGRIVCLLLTVCTTIAISATSLAAHASSIGTSGPAILAIIAAATAVLWASSGGRQPVY